MRKFAMTLGRAGILIAGLTAAPALYAQEPQPPAQRPDGSTMGPDMHRMMEMCGKMMQGGMMQGGMMQGGMMQGGMMGDPGSRESKSLTPAELDWTGGPPMLPPGASMAVIEGSFNRPGPFTVRLKFPANYRIPAHWHPGRVTVTVISGTFNLGLGDKLDTTKGKALPAGSIFEMPATTHHFGWTSEETMIQQQGIGPWGINYLNAADNPRQK